MVAPAASLPIRRNTLLLAGALAVNSAVLQLVAAVSSLTFVLVTGFEKLLGLGPAIFLTSSAVTAVPVVLGFALIGSSSGIALLVRTAAGDMYPPERRARGISYVLFGAVFGAILGPAVFGPLFSDRELDAAALTVPWLAAAGISLIALVVVSLVSPDPKRIAELLGAEDGPQPPAAPLKEILRRPGVKPAMLAALASFGVMVSVMNLSGYVVVEHHHHSQSDVFPIIGAHVLGMYALVLVVGALIDRIGRTTALATGLLVMGASTISMSWFASVPATAVLLFGLGIGWNISYVAAAAELADLTRASERGRLFGFNDFAAAMFAASLALVGGLTLDKLGVVALAVGATILVVAPAPWILGRRRSEPTAAREPA